MGHDRKIFPWPGATAQWPVLELYVTWMRGWKRGHMWPWADDFPGERNIKKRPYFWWGFPCHVWLRVKFNGKSHWNILESSGGHVWKLLNVRWWGSSQVWIEPPLSGLKLSTCQDHPGKTCKKSRLNKEIKPFRDASLNPKHHYSEVANGGYDRTYPNDWLITPINIHIACDNYPINTY